ncbi:MAG: ankyrin repeat domain-containing protein, partial [Pseudomonadales bacterium]
MQGLKTRVLFTVLINVFFLTPTLLAQDNQNLRMLAAAKAGDSERAHVLLDGASNINISEADGMNALHYATLNNDTDLVRSLVRAGAVIDVRTRYGITPIYLAVRNGS